MNRYQKKGWTIPLIFLPGLTMLLYLWTVGSGATAVVAAPPDPPTATTATEPVWTQPITLTTSADSPNGASFPTVQASPDGNTVMVVFNWRRSSPVGTTDPYYRRSSNHGEAWSPLKPIFQSSVASKQVHFDYAADGVAHVVWQENTGLDYAHETSVDPDTWSTPVQLVAPGANPGVTNPYIVASGSSRLDVAWAEGSGSAEPSIYHARSKDGGSTWPASLRGAVQVTGWRSEFPAMTVDNNTGIIHVVWQENDDIFQPNYGTIMYAQGTESGGFITWSTPAQISTPDDAREPSIILVGDALQVVYTEVTHGVDIDPDATQFVQHVTCASNCASPSNWMTTSAPISGTKLGANGVEPLNVVTALTHRGNCALSYFHGIDADLGSNEMILGVNSCSGWAASARERMTPPEVQSINPSLDVQNNWWLYLAYEKDTNGQHQIYLHRDRPHIYLPVVFR